MAFQIFYIAINVSVIVAPLIAGTLGEKVSWHWGFGTAGIVMVLGLVLYIMAGPWLPKDNRPSKAAGATKPSEPLSRQDWLRIAAVVILVPVLRSEEHTSELQSLMRISYAVFCLKQKNKKNKITADQ